MATTTFKQLKNWFAREIGELDYTAVDDIGKSLINDAHKELSSRIPLECNKKSDSLSIAANVGSVPATFDYAHENEIKIYEYSSTTAGSTKYEYRPVSFDDVMAYSTSEYVYAIDHENDQIKTNQTTKTLTIDYYAIPTDFLTDSDTTKFSIPRTISLLAAAFYWKGTEGEEKRADKAETKAEALFQQAVSRNNISKAPRKMYSVYDDFNDGESILATQR